MSDSDPRPMPAEVLRAYRDPMDLVGLLETGVYSEQDRRDVLDALVRSLVARYGDVWIAAGSKEVRVSTRVKAFKKNAAKAIELLYGLEEYGSREGVDVWLAQAMEPRWAAWWNGFRWRHYDDRQSWARCATHVLGKRQFLWLSAQYARTVIDRVPEGDARQACLRAIESAEMFSRDPSGGNKRLYNDAFRRINLSAYYYAYYTQADAAAAAAARIFVSFAKGFDDLDAIALESSRAAMNVVDAAGYASADTSDGRRSALDRLGELTRRLITPTLITRPSQGLRASGRVASQVVPAILGVAAGAGAVFLAKRA